MAILRFGNATVVAGHLVEITDTEVRLARAVELGPDEENRPQLVPVPVGASLMGAELATAVSVFQKAHIVCLTLVDEHGDGELCQMFQQYWADPD